MINLIEWDVSKTQTHPRQQKMSESHEGMNTQTMNKKQEMPFRTSPAIYI